MNDGRKAESGEAGPAAGSGTDGGGVRSDASELSLPTAGRTRDPSSIRLAGQNFMNFAASQASCSTITTRAAVLPLGI
jgi:hypothetical protein